MTAKKLNDDVLALVHHIELNESGWFDLAKRRAVTLHLWLHNEPLSPESLYDRQSELNITRLTLQEIESALDELCKEGVVVEPRSGFYGLTNAEYDRVTAAIEDAEDTEEAVKTTITAAARHALKTETVDADALWETFHREFVVPFIREFGAKAYELITGKHTAGQQSAFVSDFLDRFDAERRTVIESMAAALLDPHNQRCRLYVLRSLNAFFYDSASHLPKETINHLFGDRQKSRSIRLVLDTNFLFSLLDLHDNPSNEAVRLLTKMITAMPPNVHIGLYVLPATIDEFRRALAHYENIAAQIRPTKNLVQASGEVRLSGVIAMFLKRSKEAGFKLSPKDYFAPYHEGITHILKEKGVEILQVRHDQYTTDQRVIDDSLDQKVFFDKKFAGRPERQKIYEQIVHDMCLWYAVNDRRPNVCDTLFEADWLGVTIDYSLIAFDEHKRKLQGIPRVVHPATLVQALQVLVPNNEALDETLFALMQLPFLFDSFGIEDERASIRIIQALSRYENLNDLSAETITELLGNRVLKSRIVRTQDRNADLLLIREALVEHVTDLEKKQDRVVAELAASRKQANERAVTNKELGEKIVQVSEESEKQAAEIQQMEEVITGLRQAAAKAQESIDSSRRYEALVAKLLVISSIALTCFLAWLIAEFLWSFFENRVGIIAAIFPLFLPIPLVARGLRWMLTRTPSQLGGRLERAVLFLDRWSWAVLALVVVTLVTGWIWETYGPTLTSE